MVDLRSIARVWKPRLIDLGRRRLASGLPVPSPAGGGWSDRRLDALESRLVWIFGSPRSGSTWLLRLLTHPLAPDDEADCGVALLNAPDADRPRAVPINEPYAQHHLAPAVDIETAEDGALPLAALNEFRHASPNYFLSDRFAEAWRPHLRRLVLARLAAQVDAVQRAHGMQAAAVIIKEPNGSIGAEFVMSLLPRARMVFLLRDGRDVVDSMLDAQLPGGWLSSSHPGHGEQAALARLRMVKREAWLWRARTEAVKRAYDQHPAELRRLVRYEQARADTATTLAELESWLGLERTARGRTDALRWNDFDAFPAEVKGSGRPLRVATPGLWRQNLDEDEQAAMREIMGDRLAELGYDVYETV